MEIPYTVTPRPDTSLYNAKIGIWLFLASEVMLFGGLFSSYIFLRVGAAHVPGFEWPVGELNVTLGCINTFVLIGSSVTVILAWANLKLRNFAMFRVFMAITILCSLCFMVIKSFEYKAKFSHYAIFLKDGTRITGHELKDEGEFYSIVPDPAKAGHGAAASHAPTHAPTEASHTEESAHTATADAHAVTSEVHPAAPHAAGGHHEPIQVPKANVVRTSNFGPKLNTYYAIYFTLTGLHALHVIGGASVLTYFLITSAKMYKENPDHLANRVEVGGLFWHFVDLVWIFLFPLLYLL